MTQDQQQPHRPETFKEKIEFSYRLLLFIAKLFAMPIQFLLHGLVGERYLGFSGVFSGVFLLFYPVFFPHENPIPIYLLLAAYLTKCAVLRSIYLYRWFYKYPLGGHTQDPGLPLLCTVLPKCRAEWMVWCEPPLILVIALIVFPFNRPLGVYLFAAAVGLFGWLSAHIVHARNQLLDQHDAIIEARNKAERFREFQNR